MKTVLVTGAAGFIGKNLCAELALDKDLEVLRFTRDNSPDELKDLVKKADFVFHVAGVNRPETEDEFDTGNRGLTEELLAAIDDSGKQIPVVLTSSIQAERDNPYGTSKKAAEEAVAAWSSKTGNQVFIFRLPNVFGKWSRPNYNSVVATFCHNISRGEEITVNDPSATLTLVYVDDVVAEFKKALSGQLSKTTDDFYDIPQKYTLTLQELVDTLRAFKESRSTLVMPSMEDTLTRALYATYTSYLDTKDFDYGLEMKRDDRGWLAEFIKSKQAGAIFVSRTKPGISRGNHWHHTKIEKFLVIEGQADIKFRKVDENEVLTYAVTGEELQVLDIPAGYVHSITNTGETDLITLFWADEILDPDAPDTYFENV